MISLRSKPRPTGLFSALTLFLTACALFVALPGAALAAPGPGEGEPAPPQLAFEPASYDFGLRQLYNGGETSLQLRNVGEATAPVNSLEISGPGSYAYWINGGATSCYGRNLQPNETCWVQVGFNPSDTIQFDAQLRASSEGGTTFTADLSGEGGRAQIGPVSDPTSFGAATVGSAGVTKTIEVTNSGNYPGGAFIAVIAGGAIGSFHLLDENCTGIQLAPAATCTLQVNFQPLSSGVKTARLGLFGDSDGGTQVTLTGVGVDPVAAPSTASGPSSTNAAPDTASKHVRKHRKRKIGNRNRRLRAAVSVRRPSL